MEPREFHQVSRTGKARVWAIEVCGAEVRTSYGELGGKMQFVTDMGQRKNVGRSNEVTPEQDALYLAGRMILAKTRDGYVEEGTERATSIDWNATLPINLRFYKPENSLSVTLTKKLVDGTAWLSRKRDGEMMVVVKGPDSFCDIYSRKMLRSHHLEVGKYEWRDRFMELAHEVENDSSIPPRTILLGDVVTSPFDDGRWEVGSYVRSLTEEVQGRPPLFFYCWDIAFFDGADLLSSTTIGERYALIWDLFGSYWQGARRIVPVEVLELEEIRHKLRVRSSNTDPVEAVLTDCRSFAKKQHWEGWVVVDPYGVYGDRGHNFRGKTDRPGKYCGKLKPEYELDAVARFDPDSVLGAGPQGKWGKGNHRGQVGSVSLYQYDTRGNLIYLCDCGGGIDDRFRAKYSDPTLYPLTVTVEYTERTFIAEGDKTNALTFPRLVRVRDDKSLDECVESRL